MLHKQRQPTPPEPAVSSDDEDNQMVDLEKGALKWVEATEAAAAAPPVEAEEITRDELSQLFGNLNVRAPPSIEVTEDDQDMVMLPIESAPPPADQPKRGRTTTETVDEVSVMDPSTRVRTTTETIEEIIDKEIPPDELVPRLVFNAMMIASTLQMKVVSDESITKEGMVFAVTPEYAVVGTPSGMASYNLATRVSCKLDKSDEWEYTHNVPLQGAFETTYGIVSPYGVYNEWDLRTGQLLREHVFKAADGKNVAPNVLLVDETGVTVAHELDHGGKQCTFFYTLTTDGTIETDVGDMTGVGCIHSAYAPFVGRTTVAAAALGPYVKVPLGPDADYGSMRHPYWPYCDADSLPCHFVTTFGTAFLVLTPSKIVYMNKARVVVSDFATPFVAQFINETEFVVITAGLSAYRIRIADDGMQFSEALPIVDKAVIGGACPARFPSKEFISTNDNIVYMVGLEGSLVTVQLIN